MAGEITIVDFTDDPMGAEQIPTLHLKIRYQQRAAGENEFKSDIHSSQADLGDIPGYYIEPGGNFFIAKDTQAARIAGFVGVKRVSDAEGQIKRMSVMPGYRRPGLGRELAKRAVEWARGAGLEKLSLTTGQQENARPIYEGVGFTWVRDIPEHDDIAMELNLAA